MAIVSSVITVNDAGQDGSRIVFERHTDHLGVTYELRYTPGSGVDVNAMLTQHASDINAMLVQNEIDGILNG